MNKRLKGENEMAMSPLPIYPKELKSGNFLGLNSKLKLFRPLSYEPLKPVISRLSFYQSRSKNICKQGISMPSPQSINLAGKMSKNRHSSCFKFSVFFVWHLEDRIVCLKKC